MSTETSKTEDGVFIPHRYAHTLIPRMAVPELEPLFRRAEPAMREILDRMADYWPEMAGFRGARPPEPRWEQDWFPGLDGAAAYTLVRSRRPRRILEVGSGHSTRFLARAVRDAGIGTEVIAIDPQPRADISRLDLQVINRTLQEIKLESLPSLGAGDVLFIDSSHLALPGSDVDILFARLIPTLPAGVLIHIHDILLPDAYPETWGWRMYGEHLPVAAWLGAGGLRPLFSSHYVRTRMAAACARPPVADIPVGPGALETSLWTVKTTPSITDI